MKKLIKGIIWVLVALIVAFVAGGYVLPGEAVVQRSININAPPEKVYAVVGNMKRFNEWSPWADLDPTTKYTFEGPESGVGQKMSWASNNPNVGVGSQTIVEAVENSSTVTELDFGDMGKARASINLAAVSGGTAVTWGFKSTLKSASERWLGLMFDRWIGADYAKGLERLKALVEKEGTSG
jgi:uncharacterized protein YndB with AHSA1/START domain